MWITMKSKNHTQIMCKLTKLWAIQEAWGHSHHAQCCEALSLQEGWYSHLLDFWIVCPELLQWQKPKKSYAHVMTCMEKLKKSVENANKYSRKHWHHKESDGKFDSSWSDGSRSNRENKKVVKKFKTNWALKITPPPFWSKLPYPWIFN